MALAWEVVNKISDSAAPGTNLYYYDTRGQRIYLEGTEIKTQAGNIVKGQWPDVVYEPEKVISETGYGYIDVEHQNNGAVFIVAQHNADYVLLVYQYMMDISDMVSDSSWETQPDNPIKAGNITIKNTANDLFEDNAYSIFSPGCKISLTLRVGNYSYYDIGVFYIENSPFKMPSGTFQFNGRNKLGFFLSSQTFDENYHVSGTFTDIFASILTNAGINSKDYLIEDIPLSVDFNFDPSDTLLSGLTTILKMGDWYVDDLADGKIIIGSSSFIKNNAASVGIYSFSRGKDVFTHTIDRSISNVYSRVAVRRKGDFASIMYAPVEYYDGWNISNHRTFYIDVPDSASDELMAEILTQKAEQLQYSGIVESFDSTIRPWLQTGDIALVTDSPRYAGIITTLVHKMGESGFTTAITVTSGGVITDPESPNPASSYVGRMGGANRQRRMLDYIDSGEYSSSAGSSDVGAVTYGAAATGGYEGTEQELYENLALVGDGAVLPTGGTIGQILEKTSTDNYVTQWTDALRNINSIGFINGAEITNHVDQQILEITNSDGTTLQVGAELWFIAKANEPMVSGDLVELAGSQGDHALVKKATTAGISAMPGNFMGVVTQDVDTNGWVKCTWFGYVNDLNTASYSLGQILYFDNATAGFTNAPPTTSPVIGIAVVTRVHATAGRILVRPHFYTELPNIGLIQLWPTASAPDKWALCDGQAISRATYAGLFALIGTSYGAGDGTTTFNLPSMADPFTGVSYMIKIV